VASLQTKDAVLSGAKETWIAWTTGPQPAKGEVDFPVTTWRFFASDGLPSCRSFCWALTLAMAQLSRQQVESRIHLRANAATNRLTLRSKWSKFRQLKLVLPQRICKSLRNSLQSETKQRLYGRMKCPPRPLPISCFHNWMICRIAKLARPECAICAIVFILLCDTTKIPFHEIYSYGGRRIEPVKLQSRCFLTRHLFPERRLRRGRIKPVHLH